MSLVRLIARPMLASIFVVQGFRNVRNPDSAVPTATKFAERARPLLERQPSLPTDPRTLVRINAGVQLGAGLALATGRFPRLASLALIGSLIPTTIAGHPFWETTDPKDRDRQRIQVLKNAGLAGGLMLASVDTAGKPSLSWRAKHAAKDARRAGKSARRKGKKAAREVSSRAQHILPT